MDDKERPECPVTVEGCPPVITIAADMKWVKRGIWIAVGLIVYLLYSKSRAVTTEEDILVLEEQKAIESDKYKVMVAIANPANAAALVQGTYNICGAKDLLPLREPEPRQGLDSGSIPWNPT